MPLSQGYSKASVARNIGTEKKAGRSSKQSVAIAYSVARKNAKSAGKSPAYLKR